MVHDPLVTSPSVVGVNASISSSAAAVTPTTDGLPVVEINTRPSGSELSESMFSAFVSNPTSIPLRYMLNVPVVTLPSDVASNWTTSWGPKDRLPSVMEVLNDIRIVSVSTTEKANKSRLPTPTSDPLKSRLQVAPLKYIISSSAKDTPPTVPLLAIDK
jgi:hypothetical protein